jgi:hypothetical protein
MLAVHGKEVTIVPTDTLTKSEPTVPETTPAETPPTETVSEVELREWARHHVERVRKFKRDVAAFLLGMTALTALWAVVEWQENGGFERFSNGGNPGDWEPWIVYVALVWGFLLGIDALKTFFDRPTTEADVDRELDRLR